MLGVGGGGVGMGDVGVERWGGCGGGGVEGGVSSSFFTDFISL